MGEALTQSIIEPIQASSIEECVDAEFVSCLVCSCSSVITGIKPAELFGFMPRGRRFNASLDRLEDLAREATLVYARGLAASPIRLASLGRWKGREMLLCWRPESFDALLQDPGSFVFLDRYEFAVGGVEELANSAIERLRRFYGGSCEQYAACPKDKCASSEFPHEVGVLLGFPVEDVEGFITHSGRGELECGRWKVYGDVELAKRRFKRIARAKKRCAVLSSKGYSVCELIRQRRAPDLRGL